jgi:hypothetical protein
VAALPAGRAVNGRTGTLAERVSWREFLDLVELEPGWSLREYADRLGTSYENLARNITRHGRSVTEFDRRHGLHGPDWCSACSHCSPMIGLDVRDHGHGKSRKATGA